MTYQFDMTKLTIGDFISMQASTQPIFLIGVAMKCSLTDMSNVPITELTLFLQDFNKALTNYVTTQFPQ